jgi:hypothetical protein
MPSDQAVLVHTHEDVVDLSGLMEPCPASDVQLGDMRLRFSRPVRVERWALHHLAVMQALTSIRALSIEASRQVPANTREVLDSIAEIADAAIKRSEP